MNEFEFPLVEGCVDIEDLLVFYRFSAPKKWATCFAFKLKKGHHCCYKMALKWCYCYGYNGYNAVELTDILFC